MIHLAAVISAARPIGTGFPLLRDRARAAWLLVRLLVARDLRTNYRRALAGAGWAVARPLMTVGVFVVVFDQVMQVAPVGAPYPLFVLSALLGWQTFADAVSRGANSLIHNTSILTRSQVPHLVFPVAAVIHAVVHGLAAYAVFVALVAAYGGPWHSTAFLVLPLLLVQAAAALGLSLALSVLTVFVRDVSLALPFLLQLVMLLSPVAYPINLVPETWQPLYQLNPVVTLVEAHRDVWLRGVVPPSEVWVALSAMAMGCLLVGGIVFARLRRHVVDVIS